jgi:hypothetical protein
MNTIPTSPAEWQVPTHLVTLPSGNTVQMRKNKFPPYLLMADKELNGAYEQALGGELKDPEMALRLMNLMVTTMIVSPKVTADGASGTLSLEQLDGDDIDFVMTLAYGGTPEGGFPDAGADADAGGEPVGVGDGEDSKVLGAAAKQPPRTRARKSRSARA